MDLLFNLNGYLGSRILMKMTVDPLMPHTINMISSIKYKQKQKLTINN